MLQLPATKLCRKVGNQLRQPLLFAASFACRRFSSQLPEFDPNVDYYKALGLKQNATETEIKKAFY